MEAIVLALLALAGLAAGLASGLFGIGGGVLMVPATLYLVPAESFHGAKAASLLVTAASAGVGVLAHRRAASVDFARAAPLVAGGFLGAVIAVLLAERAPGAWLAIAFGLVLVVIGARLAIGRDPKPRHIRVGRERAFLAGTGVLAGVLAGALGVGGGIILVPAMVLAGIGTHLAVGTSLVAVLSNAAVGTGTHLAIGYGPGLLALGGALLAGALPGTYLGSRLAHRIRADRLRRGFGVALVLLGAAMALDAVA